MCDFHIVRLHDHKELAQSAAGWFHRKWGIPKEDYMQSIKECLSGESAVPQWYVVMQGQEIIAGLGVIENDFHDRRDLSPNVCAVYVEEAYRGRGIAGKMLQYVCDEFSEKGIHTLYLVTDHVSFYERYGWEFLCMVAGYGEQEKTRMYVHHNGTASFEPKQHFLRSAAWQAKLRRKQNGTDDII